MMDETRRRRETQLAYNAEHGIVPRTVYKSREEILRGTVIAEEKADQEEGVSSRYYSSDEPLSIAADPVVKYLTADQKRDLIAQLRNEMNEAAENLQFERAAELRDNIAQLEAGLKAG
jgi:excinuclease ABC subunit B